MLKIEKDSELYNELFKMMAARYSEPLSKQQIRYIHRYLNLKQIDWNLFDEFSGNVLDVGCDNPVDALILSKMKKVDSISLVDINPIPMDIDIPKTNFFKTDARELPFGDCKFDVVMSFSAIEHLCDRDGQRKWVNEMCRVTKQGGKLLITVDNAWSILNRPFDMFRPPMLCISPKDLKKWVLNNGNFEIQQFTSGLLYYYGNGLPYWRFSYPAYLFDRFINIFGSFLPHLGDRIGYRFKKLGE